MLSPVSTVARNPQRVAGLAGLASALPRYLRRPLRLEGAVEAVAERLRTRTERFLQLAEQAVYGYEPSIYRRLLLHAGCEMADLLSSVRRDGLEATLARLRAEGVHLTLEEFKGLKPVCRGAATFESDDDALANPLLRGTQWRAKSSGTRHPGTTVGYTWELFEEEAQEECILFAEHGIEESLLAYWMPGPPGIAGIHNLLLDLKCGRSPRRWFSQVPLSAAAARDKLALLFVGGCTAVAGRRMAFPRLTPMDRASVVARWMSRRPNERAPRVLKAYASSAVRMAQAAKADGIDLGGQFVFTGGEPLTEARYRFLVSSGLRVHPRYVATEAGLIGAGCGRSDRHDRMHVYVDRLAVIQAPSPAAAATVPESSFLFTSLSPHAPRILLNTELGDAGHLTEQPCECAFGKLGMSTFVSHVASPDKLTGEGMTVLGSELNEVIAGLVCELGGSPDDVQFWESPDHEGLSRVIIAVSPRAGAFDESAFKERIVTRLRERGGAGSLTAQVWEQARTLQVVRADPEPTAGHKILPITRRPDSSVT